METIKEKHPEMNKGSSPPIATHGRLEVANSIEPNSLRASVQEADAEAGTVAKNNDAPADVRGSTKKNPGLIRMIGAPVIDFVEAKKQILEDVVATKINLDEVPDLESPIVPNTHDAEYLETSNEETFTLESFESLIHAARVAGKTFMLARVTTVDPNNLSRLYYSYYAAHHINKVIFRTQPEQGFLHRMKSRNPLNNMLIVGDVHYFAISPADFDRCWTSHQVYLEEQRVLRSSTSLQAESTQQQSEENLLRNALWNGSAGHCRSSSDPPVLKGLQEKNSSSSSLSEIPKLEGPTDQRYPQHIQQVVPPMIYEATFFATDDDFLMNAEVREYFKQNSVGDSDYQLFQLHRRSDLPYELTVLGPNGEPLLYGSNVVSQQRRLSRWRMLGGLLDGGSHRNLVGLNVGYLSPLGFWVSMLTVTATVVVLALLYLPSPFFYFAFVGLVIAFCLTLIFFVDWTDDRGSSANIRSTSSTSADTD